MNDNDLQPDISGDGESQRDEEENHEIPEIEGELPGSDIGGNEIGPNREDELTDALGGPGGKKKTSRPRRAF